MTSRQVQIPLGDVPKRTRVEAVIPLENILFNYEPKHVPSLTYSCIDCPFTTKVLSEIEEHQAHPNLRHRLRRLFL